MDTTNTTLVCDVNVTQLGDQIVGIAFTLCDGNGTGNIIGYDGQYPGVDVTRRFFRTSSDDPIKYVLYTASYGNVNSLQFETKSGMKSVTFGFFPPKATRLEMGAGLLGATINYGGLCGEGLCSYQPYVFKGITFKYVCPAFPTPAPTPAPTFLACTSRTLGGYGFYTFQTADVGLVCKIDITYDLISVRGIGVTYCENGFGQGISGFNNQDSTYPDLPSATFTTTADDPIILILYNDDPFHINTIQFVTFSGRQSDIYGDAQLKLKRLYLGGGLIGTFTRFGNVQLGGYVYDANTNTYVQDIRGLAWNLGGIYFTFLCADTPYPTPSPTSLPTVVPSSLPTGLPTLDPTALPTVEPTNAPIAPTPYPTLLPTKAPTPEGPTARPTTASPTRIPTPAPTYKHCVTPLIGKDPGLNFTRFPLDESSFVCKVLATTDNKVVTGFGVELCDGRSSGIIGYQNQDGLSPSNNRPQALSTNDRYSPFTFVDYASKTGDYVNTLLFRPSTQLLFGDLFLSTQTFSLGLGLLGVNVYWGVTYPDNPRGIGYNVGAISFNYACPVPTPMPTRRPTSPTPAPTPAPTIGQIRYCVIDSYGRGVGTIPNNCQGGDYSGLLCYPQCNAGYTGVGPVCYQVCGERVSTSHALGSHL